MKTKKSVKGPLSNAVLSKSHQAVLSKPFVFKILFLLVCLLGFLNTYAEASFTSGLFIVSAEEHRLSNSLIFEKEVFSSMECAQLCLTECLRCRSINFEKEQMQTKKQRRYKCQLNNATKTFKPEELVPDTAFNYLEPMQSFNCHCIFAQSCIGTEQCKASSVPYETIGCFNDTRARAIAMIEGQDSILDGGPRSRVQAIEKCYQATKKRGFQMFSVQYGGQCLTSATAVKTFDKYGRSTDCNSDGKGGTWCSQVYYIIDYVTVGCFKDSGSDRAIRTLEGVDVTLDGPYQSRENAITKCAVAARRKGYSMFALQNGGHCKASASAPMTFNKYGKSYACQSDGKGGPWANEVYCING